MLDDAHDEGEETFTLALSNASSCRYPVWEASGGDPAAVAATGSRRTTAIAEPDAPAGPPVDVGGDEMAKVLRPEEVLVTEFLGDLRSWGAQVRFWPLGAGRAAGGRPRLRSWRVP